MWPRQGHNETANLADAPYGAWLKQAAFVIKSLEAQVWRFTWKQILALTRNQIVLSLSFDA
jgi:hypothetical protein